MKNQKKLSALRSVFLASALVGASFFPGVGLAQTYGTDIAGDFVEWCSVSQGQSATVCSCAVSKAAIEIPATAMASFLAAPEGAGAATVGAGIGATALQIVATCAAAGASAPQPSSGLDGALKSIGSGFGR